MTQEQQHSNTAAAFFDETTIDIKHDEVEAEPGSGLLDIKTLAALYEANKEFEEEVTQPFYVDMYNVPTLLIPTVPETNNVILGLVAVAGLLAILDIGLLLMALGAR